MNMYVYVCCTSKAALKRASAEFVTQREVLTRVASQGQAAIHTQVRIAHTHTHTHTHTHAHMHTHTHARACTHTSTCTHAQHAHMHAHT